MFQLDVRLTEEGLEAEFGLVLSVFGSGPSVLGFLLLLLAILLQPTPGGGGRGLHTW